MIVCVRNKYIQKDRAKHTKNIHNNNFSIKSNEHLASSKPPLSRHWEPFCPSELFDKCFLSCNICKWWSNNWLTISCVCVIAPQSACKPHSDCVNQQRARYVWNGFLRKRISLSLSIWNRKRPTVIRPAITNHQPIKNLCLVFFWYTRCAYPMQMAWLLFFSAACIIGNSINSSFRFIRSNGKGSLFEPYRGASQMIDVRGLAHTHHTHDSLLWFLPLHVCSEFMLFYFIYCLCIAREQVSMLKKELATDVILYVVAQRHAALHGNWIWPRAISIYFDIYCDTLALHYSLENNCSTQLLSTHTHTHYTFEKLRENSNAWVYTVQLDDVMWCDVCSNMKSINFIMPPILQRR